MSLSGTRVPVVVFPRYTTFYGGIEFPSHAMSVRPYEGMEVNAWMGEQGGTGATSTKLSFRQSMDRIRWEPIPSMTDLDLSAGVEVRETVKFTLPWFRITVILGGSQPISTLWVEGFFMERHE